MDIKKVDNKFDSYSKSAKLSDDYHYKIDTNQNYLAVSEKNGNNDQFLSLMKFEEDNLHRMKRRYNTSMKKHLIKLIRIMAECVLKK
jgi:hypothetical protein